MSQPDKEWIDTLAAELKQQGRDAAEAYGRAQHRSGIVAEQSPAFFTALTLCLEEDFAALRARLQGSAVASETMVERTSLTELRLTRARFPWFEATLKHEAETLCLDYGKERGTAPLLASNPQSAHFNFHVDTLDRLAVAESFSDTPRYFNQPADLSRHLVDLLFKVW